MNITVIGCGRWGTFIAWYLHKIGNEVTLYGRAASAHMAALQETRTNGLVTLGEEIRLATSLEALPGADVIVISVNSQGLSALMGELAPLGLRDKVFVLCMKGIEVDTGKRLSQIVSENTDPANAVAVWLGPGHVQEFCRGVPNCMVIDSADEAVKVRLANAFSSDLIRIYYGQDLIGSEIGGAAKNVIGIAAGMLDGLQVSALKGALMSRGAREIARLIAAMGGNELSAYGLCHLGDYEATVFSPFSHNRRFGECFVQGIPFPDLAEGYYTVKALIQLSQRYGVELPICRAVYDVLYDGREVKPTFDHLFERSLKKEF